MQINPYLIFNGNCEAAFRFYARCLGGQITMMLTNGDSPMANQIPAELHHQIMHATLTVGDRVLQGADRPPEHYKEANGFSVQIGIGDPAEAEAIFHALAEYGKVTMPIQQTFWSVRFGMLVDQFGIPWMVNCEQAA